MKKNKFRILSLLMTALMVVPTIPVYAANEQSESSAVLADVESNFEISIPKQLEMIVDSNWHGAASYEAYVTGDIEIGSSVYVVPQSRFNMVNQDDESVPDVVTTVTQDKVEWTSADCAAEDPIVGNGALVGDDFGPGRSEGIFYFNIEKNDSGKDVSAPGDKIITGEFENTEGVVDAGTYQIGEGQTASINMSYGGKDVTSKTIYESDNERITVDGNGKVNISNAVGGDEATITATYTRTVTTAGIRSGLLNPTAAASGLVQEIKTLTAQFHIQVIGIRFDKDKVVLRPGDSVTVNADILPDSVSGTVKWTLNGLDFGSTGNSITINISDDATPGNYILVASYNGTVQTLNIEVKEAINLGIIDGGEYVGPITITPEEGSTVTVNGNGQTLDSDGSFIISNDGTYVIVITDQDGFYIVYNITVTHNHDYVDGFCSICNKTDESMFSSTGLWTASGKKLASWLELTEDYNFDPSADYTSDTTLMAGIMSNNAVNPSGANCILVLPDSVESIGAYALYNCDKLKGIVANGITSVGTYSFSKCVQLKDCTFLSHVTTIGSYSFRESGIITLPSLQASTVPNGAFQDCNNLTSVDLTGVTNVGSYAFRGCTKLSNLTIDYIFSELVSIGDYAFYNCPIDGDIVVPSTVTSLGTDAFGSVTPNKTRKVIFEPSGLSNRLTFPSAKYAISYRVASYIPINIINYYSHEVTAAYSGEVSNFTGKCWVADKLCFTPTSSQRFTLANCDSVEAIAIPSGVTEINGYENSLHNQDRGIRNNPNLKYLYIPETVTKIDGVSKGLSGLHNDLVIYCEAPSKPDGWKDRWDYYSVGSTNNYKNATVIWGASREDFNKLMNEKYFNNEIDFTKVISD